MHIKITIVLCWLHVILGQNLSKTLLRQHQNKSYLPQSPATLKFSRATPFINGRYNPKIWYKYGPIYQTVHEVLNEKDRYPPITNPINKAKYEKESYQDPNSINEQTKYQQQLIQYENIQNQNRYKNDYPQFRNNHPDTRYRKAAEFQKNDGIYSWTEQIHNKKNYKDYPVSVYKDLQGSHYFDIPQGQIEKEFAGRSKEGEYFKMSESTFKNFMPSPEFKESIASISKNKYNFPLEFSETEQRIPYYQQKKEIQTQKYYSQYQPEEELHYPIPPYYKYNKQT